MQEKLPDVVPLLIGIDKTVLTQHHGDLSAWPIYMTLGNLDSHSRRPKRTHEYTQQLIAWQRQNTSDISKEEKAMMVHDVGCFAWSHPYTRIHTAMMVHQLLKGVIHYLIE